MPNLILGVVDLRDMGRDSSPYKGGVNFPIQEIVLLRLGNRHYTKEPVLLGAEKSICPQPDGKSEIL